MSTQMSTQSYDNGHDLNARTHTMKYYRAHFLEHVAV